MKKIEDKVPDKLTNRRNLLSKLGLGALGAAVTPFSPIEHLNGFNNQESHKVNVKIHPQAVKRNGKD